MAHSTKYQSENGVMNKNNTIEGELTNENIYEGE